MATTKESDKYLNILRGMGGEKRLAVGFELYEMAVGIVKSAIEEENRDIDKEQLDKLLLKRLGYDTARSTH